MTQRQTDYWLATPPIHSIDSISLSCGSAWAHPNPPMHNASQIQRCLTSGECNAHMLWKDPQSAKIHVQTVSPTRLEILVLPGSPPSVSVEPRGVAWCRSRRRHGDHWLVHPCVRAWRNWIFILQEKKSEVQRVEYRAMQRSRGSPPGVDKEEMIVIGANNDAYSLHRTRTKICRNYCREAIVITVWMNLVVVRNFRIIFHLVILKQNR